MSRKPLKVSVDDFVNFQVEGLTPQDIRTIRKQTSFPVKGAFTTAAFKAKIWDGRESLFSEEGVGVLSELENVLGIIEDIGYDLDDDIHYNFNQPDIDLDVPPVNEDFVKKYSGYSYRDYQVNSVNSVILKRKGILDIGTNGGKTWICVGVSKAFDPVLKSVIIVPSENLVNQTYEDYKKTSLNVVALTKNVKPAKREEVINSARHVILTTKLFLNCYEYFSKEPWVMMIDEAHQWGTVFSDIIRCDMAHCPVRIGLTATLPKTTDDPYKRHCITSIIGGGVLEQVKQEELISRGISSAMKIKVVSTSDYEMEELSDATEFDWSIEESYLRTNINRVEAIADYIKTFETTNTLILCHAAFATRLGEILGYPVIVDKTPTSQREEWFAEFGTRDDMNLIATFDCAGTGISVNRIFREFIIDVGKNERYILQGIGRGLRLDGVHNNIELIDIHARTKYSLRHLKERLKIYKNESFDFVQEKEFIMVNR